MLYEFDEITLAISLGILAILLIVLAIKKRSFSYLLFFLIFGIYIIGVISVVIFPILVPGPEDAATIWQRLHWIRQNINLVPFNFGDYCNDIRSVCGEQIIQNIILTMPFGFGICFIAPLKARDFFWLPFAVGLGFEISQFVISQGSFHAFDINDVILNAAGIIIGYACFRIFGWMYRGTIHLLKINPRWLFAYVYDVVK